MSLPKRVLCVPSPLSPTPSRNTSTRRRPRRRRQWTQQPEQAHDSLVLVAVEPLDQRSRHPLSLRCRHETSTQRFPCRRRRKLLAPPTTPALDRATADLEFGTQLGRAPCGHAVHHRRHEHYDDTEIHPPAQVPHRRRRCSPPAALGPAAQAEPLRVVFAQVQVRTAWLPRVVRPVQSTAAPRAARPPGFRGNLLVNSKQCLVQAGTPEQSLAQGSGLRFFTQRRPAPWRACVKLVEGATFVSLSDLAQERASSLLREWRC